MAYYDIISAQTQQPEIASTPDSGQTQPAATGQSKTSSFTDQDDWGASWFKLPDGSPYCNQARREIMRSSVPPFLTDSLASLTISGGGKYDCGAVDLGGHNAKYHCGY